MLAARRLSRLPALAHAWAAELDHHEGLGSAAGITSSAAAACLQCTSATVATVPSQLQVVLRWSAVCGTPARTAAWWQPHTRTCLGLRWLHTPEPDQPQQPPTGPTPVDKPLSIHVDSWTTAPNLLSIARAVSGPFIAALILQGSWPWAVAATALAGASDWADGALARRLGQASVLGSYLDPLADKVLVGCVVGALAIQGAAPTWVAVLVLARDVGLVLGMALHRWRTLGWRTSGITSAQFFSTAGMSTGDAGLPLMQPLLVSKVNTVLQLALVCGCMTHAWLGLPGAHILQPLELVTAATTCASLAAYVLLYARGKLLPVQTRAAK